MCEHLCVCESRNIHWVLKQGFQVGSGDWAFILGGAWDVSLFMFIQWRFLCSTFFSDCHLGKFSRKLPSPYSGQVTQSQIAAVNNLYLPFSWDPNMYEGFTELSLPSRTPLPCAASAMACKVDKVHIQLHHVTKMLHCYIALSIN